MHEVMPFNSQNFYSDWDKVIQGWFANQNVLSSLQDKKNSLSVDYLPEPYYGDMDHCSIVIINLNPGVGMEDQHISKKNEPGCLVNYVNGSNYSTMAKGFPLVGQPTNVPMPKDSVNWWKPRLRWINSILGHKGIGNAKKPFAIELVPLHSKSFKVNAPEYVKNQCPVVLDAIDDAISKSDAKMGLAIGKPIYDTLLATGYSIVSGPLQPDLTRKRFYCIIENNNSKNRILCTWSSGSNKAPAAKFSKNEKSYIKQYFQP